MIYSFDIDLDERWASLPVPPEPTEPVEGPIYYQAPGALMAMDPDAFDKMLAEIIAENTERETPPDNTADLLQAEREARKSELQARAQRAVSVADDATETDDRLVDAMSWLAVAPEPVDPVVESLFEKGDKIAVFGKSKTRKSFFVLQLAFSLVAGRDFIGMAIPTRRRVLLIQLEIKPSHMHRRCRAMAYALGVEHIEGLHIFNGRGANLTEGAIIRLARDTQADVVIVDPIYKLGTLDESSEPMAAVMRMFDQVIEATGASLIYVHHDKKGSSGDLDLVDRGSGSGIVGRDYDSAMFLTPHVDGKAVVIEYITRNHPPQGGTVARFEDGCFNVDGMAPVQVETSRSQATRRSKGETVQQLVERAIEMMTPGEKILKAEFRSRLESSGVAINKAKEITTIICERPDFESTIAKGFPAKYYIERLTASTTGTGGTNE